MWHWYVLAATPSPRGHASTRVHTGICVDDAIRAAAAITERPTGHDFERDYNLPDLAPLTLRVMSELIESAGGRVIGFSGHRPADQVRKTWLLAGLPVGRLGVLTREHDIAYQAHLGRCGSTAPFRIARASAPPGEPTDSAPNTDKLFRPYRGPL